MLALPRFIGGAAGLRVALFTPLLLASMPFMLVLQWGQVHLLVIGASVAGMIAFARGRTAAGAMLLGAAVVTKIFPGVLVVYLAVRGRRREALATACACAAISLLALLVLGPAPFRAFFGYQLPRMSTGEAFSFFQRGWLYVSRNLSVSGVVFKLRELGVGDGSARAAGAVGWAYTIVVLGLAALAARRPLDWLAEASVWLGLLALGSLRSPFAPTVYVVAPVLWLLALRPMYGALGVAAMVGSWLVTMGPPPLPVATVELVTSLVVQSAVVFFAVRAVVRPPCADAPARHPEADAPALVTPEHVLS